MSATAAPAPNTMATLKQVSDYFKLPGETLKSFTEQWKNMPEADKTQLRTGLGNGSMTY